MLTEEHTKLINKYSFIEKSYKYGAFIYIHYRENGITKIKTIPIRTTIKQLQSILSKIKQSAETITTGKNTNSEYFII